MALTRLDINYYESESLALNEGVRSLPTSGIRRMVNLASTMDDVVHLSIGQPDFQPPAHVIDAAIEALQAGKTGYTMDAGLPRLLDAIAQYCGRRCGCNLGSKNILVTSGATEATFIAISAIARPGCEIIVPDPSFLLYAPLVRMNGGIARRVPTSVEDGHQLDPKAVIDAIGPATTAIVINSPNNPTGAIYPRDTIAEIMEAAARHGIKVISDEVYDHLVYGDVEHTSVLSCDDDLEHSMVIGACSKTFAMTGLRVGWLIADQRTIKRLRRYHMYTTSVANTPGQWAAVAALEGPLDDVDRMVAEYHRRRDRIVELIEETPYLTGYSPDGAFYIFPSLPHDVDPDLLALRMLRETGVCAVPGTAFGEISTNALRMSYATSMDQIEEAFKRIIPWLEERPFYLEGATAGIDDEDD